MVASTLTTTARSGSVILCAATLGVIVATFWWKQRQSSLKIAQDYETDQGNKVSSSVVAVDDTPPPMNQIHANVNNTTSDQEPQQQDLFFRILTRRSITIVHGSVTGTCQKMAQSLATTMAQAFPSKRVQMASIQDFDWWDELINDENDDDDDNTAKADILPLLLILLPTFTQGSWTVPSQPLQDSLQELSTDWRIAQFPLKGKLQFSVMGVGSSAYDSETFGKPAREAVRQLQTLGAKCVARLAVGDSAVGNHAWETFESWGQTVTQQINKKPRSQKQLQQQKRQQKQPKAKSKPVTVAEEKPSNTNDCSTDKENGHNECACKDKEANGETTDGNELGGCQTLSKSLGDKDSTGAEQDYVDDDSEEEREPEVIDLEDMGDAILASNTNNDNISEPREMVTPSQAAALKKEGYKLIGSHSAVKLCRWTKHQLRGRGGCYKHTFYGITSYQCMEATPSLACANKCVFCWRHHKNPVGKEWRWKTDEPDFIVQQAVETHIQMIKETRGIPGLRLDRWNEAHTIRHCALSLVGEPIMYPRIGELLGELHDRHISSFLVTNGQHPAAIETLRPVTQLYVSVDAPTQASLIEIDRPLFNDAWERLRQSLSSLKAKGQRTVARLTVVKGWNSDEISGYAELIALGHVGLVEVKGVTYCGKSDASNLNMSNSPWHHEVVALTQQLHKELQKLRQQQLDSGVTEDILPEYGLACEHKHSCSVLLARVDQFANIDPVTGNVVRWNTWINYDKFQQLAAQHTKDPTQKFSAKDYAAPTPDWALFGANEEGFDPTETRHRKNTKHPKYTQFDDRGIPTHDAHGQPLSDTVRAELTRQMERRIQELGSGGESVITESRDGTKTIQDPSLMFRGMVVTK